MHRTGETAYTAGCLGHFFFIRKLNCVLANVQSIYKFGHIQFSVTAYKCRNIPILISESIISHKQQCLYRLLLVELQIICHLIDSLGSRCVHLFKWKHFNAILLPTGGKVYVDGMDTSDENNLLAVRATVGMVFQNPDNQIVANVVEDDVAFAPENLGVPSQEIRARVDAALKQVGMYDFRLHAPHLLSGGQKQRVAIAGVIAMQPKCIVLDEPTAMLDPAGRREVIDTATKLCREQGITVVLITHHMEECIGADRVIVLSNGAIVADGAPKQVFAQVDLLKKEGLTAPVTVRLLHALRAHGMDVPIDALTVSDCADAVAAALKR